MIIGVYSDMHSNIFAMEAMFALTANRVDQWLCAGDSVGLFPYVNEVLDLQRKCGVLAVCGDHEKMLLSGECMTHSYSGNQALVAQRHVVTEENKAYLRTLKDELRLEFDGIRIKLVHVLFPGTSSGKYDIQQDKLDIQHAGFDFIIFGHTHLATVLYGRDVVALNPGAAGFPVDAGRRPSMLLLDTKQRSFEFVRFDMDIEQLKHGIKSANYNPKLIRYLNQNFQWN